MNQLKAWQTDTNESQTGMLRVDVVSIIGSRPIAGVTVRVSYSDGKNTTITEVVTDVLGRTPVVELDAPNIAYSLSPSAEQPYATYDIEASAPGFETVEISSAHIFAEQLAIQNIRMIPLDNAQGESAELFVIGPNTLFGDYPPKIAEAEVKPINETGEIVLSKVVIPEFVVVHDGPPSDSSAKNYYVKYKDYIKNVASCEIYSTWAEAAITANVLAIQSFCLNRVYTEWYRNKGYNFTITTSTAYDQKYIPGKNIFESIDRVVDQIFANYLARPGISQPIFTQYCDGKNVSCPKWMTKWGSKEMGEAGYTAIEIIHSFYGKNMYIATAEEVSGIPVSWGGVDLTVGSTGEKVSQLQNQLNVISNAYPLIPKVLQDGSYGTKTAEAVIVFQGIFNLEQTGIVDYPTWYKISEIYVGVSRITELV